MRDHAGDVRAFTHTGKSWYAKTAFFDQDVKDEIMIGFYGPDGGTSGEFAVRWVTVGGKHSPRLEAFDDAWSALSHFSDLLALMADHDGEDLSPEDFIGLLDACGIENRTQYHRS